MTIHLRKIVLFYLRFVLIHTLCSHLLEGSDLSVVFTHAFSERVLCLRNESKAQKRGLCSGEEKGWMFVQEVKFSGYF